MRQLQLSSLATAVVLAVGVATAAHAAERATPREARTMFEQAVRYMEENGAERAFAAFNDRQGKFVRKDLYVFAIDDRGVYHASGAAPEALVGVIVADDHGIDMCGTRGCKLQAQVRRRVDQHHSGVLRGARFALPFLQKQPTARAAIFWLVGIAHAPIAGGARHAG